MNSGFISEKNVNYGREWQPTWQVTSGRFECLKLRSFGALYFVKRPAAYYRNDLLTQQALEKEFQIGSKLDHPSIAKYFKIEDGAIFEEYIDGLSLREMIDRNDRRISSPEFIRNVCRQLLKATSYLHSQRVIHNDIKPENVMITRIGEQLKLVDLGCATTDMWDIAEGYTPSYKAPEQGSEPTNIHTDIFLVGKLMEELSTVAGVKSQWEDFVNRATCKVPKFRFSSDETAMQGIPSGGLKTWINIIFILLLIITLSVVFNYVTSDFFRWLFTYILSLFDIQV